MGEGHPLTKADLRTLQNLIQEKFAATVKAYSAQPFTVPEAVLSDWRRRGIIAQAVTANAFISNAYVFGRLKKAFEAEGVQTLSASVIYVPKTAE